MYNLVLSLQFVPGLLLFLFSSDFAWGLLFCQFVVFKPGWRLVFSLWAPWRFVMSHFSPIHCPWRHGRVDVMLLLYCLACFRHWFWARGPRSVPGVAVLVSAPLFLVVFTYLLVETSSMCFTQYYGFYFWECDLIFFPFLEWIDDTFARLAYRYCSTLPSITTTVQILQWSHLSTSSLDI